MHQASEESYRPPRALVLCFDGTNGQYSSKNTNVVKFYSLLRSDCPELQMAYYQAGIGTYFAPGIVSPLFTGLASLMDEAVGWYLDVHVMGGYKYLMENYRAGDKICLFGFSRGAYTARALAGMLNKVGLLQKDNVQQVNFAYKAYTRTDKEGIELAAGFKRTFSQDVTVEFVGVWDTVQSTGMLVNRVLPFTAANCVIRVFRHALSLDEHRSRFRPNLYHWPTQIDAPGDEPGVLDVERGQRQTEPDEEVALTGMRRGTKFVAEESFKSTDVLEVWFSGCHSDVGGGNVQDDVEVSLAQITLHWMIEQVMESKCGIMFDSDALERIGFKASPSPQTLDATGATDSAVQESLNGVDQPTFPERSDAIAPLFDELKINKLWWILELLPFTYAWQDDKGLWHSKWSINLGRGRFIPFHKPKFHHTVKQRMGDKPLNYTPQAVFDHEEVFV